MWSAAAVLAVATGGAALTTGWGGKAVSTIASAYDAVAPGAVTYSRSNPIESAPEIPAAPRERVAHLPTPVPLKAIYMTQCVVGTPSFREELVQLLDETELNAVVIDIRDFSGGIAFPTDNPVLKDMVSDKCGARDMKDFIAMLHEKNIYVIGRVTVFQNPLYTEMHPEQAVQRASGGVWKDHKGLAFVDVGATAYWDTVVELAKESYALGFDEINFDYIRYPSDGPMKEAVFIKRDGKTKQEILEEFFKYLHDQLEPTGVVTSADLFGMVTTNYDDLNIGQVLERALPYFDYIAPMVYPSHYPAQFNGWKDPNAVPYELIKFVMDSAVERTVATSTPIASLAYERIGTSTPAVYAKPSYPSSKIRPWLQDFDYPVEYTPAMVAAQIKGNEDAGLDSYMFWDPANKYTSLRQILRAE
ncbi:MAG TPA: putative glycoside hydrolase [Candidatus Paceibacterota bacterium]|nr:putative glycoside hydrolase [Candidatus Paceibacterota bacterium]